MRYLSNAPRWRRTTGRGGSAAYRARRHNGAQWRLETLESRVVLSGTTYSTLAQFNLGTYTVDADFEKGVMFNVQHDDPAHDQLQLEAKLTTFPTMWIANAGEDTVSKIDTTANVELARYRTWFGPEGEPGFNDHYNQAWSGAAPSRTAVDREGNVYVANRQFESNRPATVVKILASGGIDRNGNGVIDTSSDLNGNGYIGTNGVDAPVMDAGEIMPLADTDGNGKIDPGEIQDERVAWAVDVGPDDGCGRSLAIDVQGNIWVGLFNDSSYYKLDGETGAILSGPISTNVDGQSHYPYGALVDGNGILWGASLGYTLLRLDTKTEEVTLYNHSNFGSNYGIAIGNGKVYLASSSNSNSYIEFDPSTETFSAPGVLQYSSCGVAVDRDGNIVVGKSTGGGVAKFAPDGSLIWEATKQAGTGHVRGVVVDSNNDVWCIHLNENRLSKFQGADGAPLGVIESGNSPYTYTDATGLTRFTETEPYGRWTVVQDSGTAGTQWGRIYWNREAEGCTPEGTCIMVQARAADSQEALEGLAYTDVQNDAPFEMTGQFIQVRATLQADVNLTTPVLSDITIATIEQPEEPPVVVVEAPTVVSLARQGYHLMPTQIVVGFSQPMDPVRAAELGCYRLIFPGCDNVFGNANDKVVPIRSATYNAETNQVVLQTARRLPLNQTYRLICSGNPETGLRNMDGVALDGAGTGEPGSDYLSLIDRKALVMTSRVVPKPVTRIPHQPLRQPIRVPAQHVVTARPRYQPRTVQQIRQIRPMDRIAELKLKYQARLAALRYGPAFVRL